MGISKKLHAAGEVTKSKARLVAHKFTQRYGEDYQEIFASVMNNTTTVTSWSRREAII